MADGDHLPSNEELFEQPVYEPQQDQIGMNQPPVQQTNNEHNYELVEQGNAEPSAQLLDEILGVPEDPQSSGVGSMDFRGDNNREPHEMMEPHVNYYPEDEQHQIRQPPANRVFQPTAYVPPVYVPPQPRANNGQEGDHANGDQNQEEEEDDEENMARFDANEHTVWIDSDGDEETENIILKQNFFLPYSDHNYDTPDPSERVIHPQEGPFPIIGGLDEEGNVIRQYMPPGYEAYGEEFGVPDELELADRAAAEEARLAQIQHQQQPHAVQQQYQPQQHHVPPSLVPQQLARRPVNAVPPYAGNHMEYETVRATVPQRGVVPMREQPYRPQHEYGTPLMAAQPRVVQPNNRTAPTTVILRGTRGPQEQVMYQPSPRANQPPAQRVAAMIPQQGTYQHILNPTSGVGSGILRRSNPQQQPQLQGQRVVPVGPGIVAGQQRPVQRTNPQPRGIVDMQEREFVEHPLPLSHPPRRIQDVAPHRMTQEQRQEMQQQNRPRAQFPTQLGQRPAIGVRPTGMSAPPGTVISAQGTVLGPRMARVPGAPSHEDLSRSPQRAPQPVHEQRRFQVKVTDTYSTPIPKPSDQLPAQLTEDPDEPSTSAASAPVTVPKEQEVARDIPEEAKPPVTMKSPVRTVSATSSPVKPQQHQHGGLQKPTPPHRMTQEEKNAHFAKLEKPAPSAQPGPSSSTPSTSSSMHQHHQLPPHLHLRADDTLSVVQSVFESQHREPDTPKDKEEISKIANELKFSADKFSGNQQRQRTISGRGSYPQMPHPQQMQHHPNQHQNPMDMMHDGRKRHPSIGRYDMNLAGQVPQRPIPPHLRNQEPDPEPRIRHPEAGLEPPHRPRGRPRGSTGPQRARWPDGQEPVAPHRVGARTLPPRQPPTQPARSGAPVQNNSDSESEGIEGDGEESWEMRCHCGMDHGDGETVECDECKTWQHMGCMGLNVKSDVSQYKCEKCLPRKLPVTRAEARKIQHKVLERLIKAGEKEDRKKEKARKSEPVEPVKQKQSQQPSTSRKSAPMPIQQHQQQQQQLQRGGEIRVPQLNEYSKAAAQLLASMHQTAGADTLLEDSRCHKKARRMFVEESVEALVTTEVVAIRQVILEMNGYVSMSNEVKRQPGGGNAVFMYDGLMKGTSGEEMGDGQELVCVDAKKKGNDSRFCRRSCIPNCVLKHVLGSQATLGIMIVATKDIHRNVEVTLPFDADWRDSDVPLECAEHLKELQMCPFEAERRRYANERHRSQETERRKAEEARRADEERRRLEDEVRLERAARTRQMDEEAELERMAQERAKKAERDEARKKKEAEKAEKKLEAERKEAEEKAKRDAEEKVLTEKKAEEKRKTMELEKQKEAEKKKKLEEDKKKKQEEKEKKTAAEKAKAPTEKLSREERKIQQIEEIFRHQEEREERAKSQTPVRDDVPSTSGPAPVRVSARQKNRRDSQSSDASSIATPGTTGKAKRMQSVASDFATPAAKRVRATTVATNSPQDSATRKRGAAATTSAKSSATKRTKHEHATRGEFQNEIDRLAECGVKTASKGHNDYSLPDYDEPVSDWVSKFEDNKAKKKAEKEKREKDAENRKRKQAEADEKLAKLKADAAAAEEEKRQKQAKKAEKAPKKEQEKEKTPEASAAPIVPKTPKSVAPKEQTKKDATPAQAPEKPNAPKPSAPAPKDQPSSSQTPKTVAPQISKASAPKETAPTSSVSNKTPVVAKPVLKDDFHGMEREASNSTEGSVEKDVAPTAGAPVATDKKIPKKLSMAEYAQRKKQETASSSATSSGASSSTTPARRGFIPSTDGSELVNVQLSAIPLDDHMTNKSTTTTAPSAPTGASGTPADTITSPSRRARGAPSDSSSADESAHSMDLLARASVVFGLGQVAGQQQPQQRAPQPSAQEPLAPRVRNRPTRWND
ncbi:unnamed protein product [Caenorhabditis brenneri]